jgi:hypothetical protein
MGIVGKHCATRHFGKALDLFMSIYYFIDINEIATLSIGPFHQGKGLAPAAKSTDEFCIFIIFN